MHNLIALKNAASKITSPFVIVSIIGANLENFTTLVVTNITRNLH